MLQIAILNELIELEHKSVLLSKQLDLPLIDANMENYDFVLAYTKDHLELRQPSRPNFQPIYIDFLSQGLQYRQRISSRKNELIARAVGIKPGRSLTVVDATTGLGTDAMVLASLGCRIIMLERSPIIAALLNDALYRAKANEEFTADVELLHTDAIEFFRNLSKKNPQEFPDVVYLDPMFPERKKSALVKKEMRMLHDLVGKDVDADRLLTSAKLCVKNRVVVKRPKLAPHLGDQIPDIIFRGKTCRYDVYLRRK